MKDNLEKYIQDHKAEFDSEQAPPLLWDKITDDLDQAKSKTRSLYRMIRVAATGIVLVAAGLLIGLRLGGNNQVSTSESYTEFTKAESYYNNQVQVKWSQLQSSGIETSSLEEDLQQLDNVYTELKAELMQNPNINTEKVVNALIENYRTKIEILETVYERTQSKNLSNLKFEDHEVDEI